jgi:DNA adenine methylase
MIRSPLSYPHDDRHDLLLQIVRSIPASVDKICAPFFTGGTIELNFAAKVPVTGYCRYRELYDFWNCVLFDAWRVSKMAGDFLPIENEHLFSSMQKMLRKPHDDFLRAALFYVLNRCAKGGALSHGSMEEGHPRFNRMGIIHLEKFSSPNLKVLEGDFEKAIEDNPDTFLYCSPPKFEKARLLSAPLSVEDAQIDHNRLAELLKARDNWMLVYDNCPDVLDLYKDYDIKALTVSGDEKGAVLIVG